MKKMDVRTVAGRRGTTDPKLLGLTGQRRHLFVPVRWGHHLMQNISKLEQKCENAYEVIFQLRLRGTQSSTRWNAHTTPRSWKTMPFLPCQRHTYRCKHIVPAKSMKTRSCQNQVIGYMIFTNNEANSSYHPQLSQSVATACLFVLC